MESDSIHCTALTKVEWMVGQEPPINLRGFSSCILNSSFVAHSSFKNHPLAMQYSSLPGVAPSAVPFETKGKRGKVLTYEGPKEADIPRQLSKQVSFRRLSKLMHIGFASD